MSYFCLRQSVKRESFNEFSKESLLGNFPTLLKVFFHTYGGKRSVSYWDVQVKLLALFWDLGMAVQNRSEADFLNGKRLISFSKRKRYNEEN